MKRTWADAPQYDRCKKRIRLRDGTTADCGRKATKGDFCWQHQPKPAPGEGGTKCECALDGNWYT